ncbi:MAG TPA: DUF4232 domain-containing protein [Propionibacterium sp.]|jgi:hypothetical protein|nr:DUF4232 domain-containing protein [Propionibacterium sp.]
MRRFRILAACGAALALSACGLVPSIPAIPFLDQDEPYVAPYDDSGVEPTPRHREPEEARTDPAPAEEPEESEWTQPAPAQPGTLSTMAPDPTVPTQAPRQRPAPVAPTRAVATQVVPPAGTLPPVNVSDCTPAELDVVFEPDPKASGPGYDAYLIWMTNTSSRSCEILGFPGVAFVTGPGGSQIGAAADRDRIYKSTRFVLEPGRQAASEVRVKQPGQFTNCRATTASYLQVIVPNTWTAFLYPANITACSNPDALQLSVRASRKVL